MFKWFCFCFVNGTLADLVKAIDCFTKLHVDVTMALPLVVFELNSIMYQSNRSFNVPPRQRPGHLNFWKIFVQIPPPLEAEKLFKCPIMGPFQVIKCPHPRETFR